MARVGKSGVQFARSELPASRGESSSLDRRKELIAAKRVVEEVKKRVTQFRGMEARAEREKEKEKEEKMEKARAAAWAWYQHGKGGKESISSGGGPAGSVSSLSVRTGGTSGELGHKSSRFKTEALKGSGSPVPTRPESDRSWSFSPHSTSLKGSGSPVPTRPESDQSWSFSPHSTSLKGSGSPVPTRPESERSWSFSPHSTSRTSSLFDTYELNSVSRRIDIAFQSEISAAPQPVLPAPMRPPGAYVPKVSTVPPPNMSPGSISSPNASTSTSTLGRSRSFRLHFPRSLCRSISDVVSREEMSLGVDIRKCDCQKSRPVRTGSGGWSFRRLSRAVQVIMHVPECQYHPQQKHHDQRHARLHHQAYHLRHLQHDHDHHHHLHYQIKLRDGVHHGNSFTTHPGKSDPLAEVPKERDHLLFPRLSPRMSPKVSPKLF